MGKKKANQSSPHLRESFCSMASVFLDGPIREERLERRRKRGGMNECEMSAELAAVSLVFNAIYVCDSQTGSGDGGGGQEEKREKEQSDGLPSPPKESMTSIRG